MHLLDLRAEMTEDEDRRLVGSDEDGADEEFKVVQPFHVAVEPKKGGKQENQYTSRKE